MHSLTRKFIWAAIFASLVVTLPAYGEFYKQTNLVSDLAGNAALQDPN